MLRTTLMTLATGLTLLACTASTALGQEAAPLPKPRLQIPGSPAALSPKGERVLWLARGEAKEGEKRGGFEIHALDLSDAAAKPRKVLDLNLPSDDYYSYLHNGGPRQWAPAGDRFGFTTRSGPKGSYVCGIATLDGKTQVFKGETDTFLLCFDPRGTGGYYVEGNFKGRPPGFELRTFGGDAERVVYASESDSIYFLDPSPQGTRLGLILGNRKVGLSVGILELKTGKLTKSKPIRVDDHFLKPRLQWTPSGDALILTTRGKAGKWPANVVRCDAKSGELKVLVAEAGWAVGGVLRNGLVSLYDRSEKKVALLDPKTGTLSVPNGEVFVLQQVKGRSLVFEPKRRALFVD
ncbi:MAG: hypothetical protein JKY65_30340 [Planctomycetes bacterium]|nr:hypothetical protein [Planctomycetota bacterium]